VDDRAPQPQGTLLPNDRTLSRFDLRLAALFFAGFATFIDMYAPQPLLPALRNEYHVSAGTVSLCVSATTLAVALSAPFIGLLADRLGRKKVISTAILILTLPTALAATSQNLMQLIGWRFAQGLCLPGIIAVTMAYISEEWRDAGAGQAMSFYVSGTVLGGFCGRFITGIVAQYSGWREAFLVLAAVNLIGWFVVWRALPKARNFKAQKDTAKAAKAMLMHFRNTDLLAVYAVGFAVLFCLVGAFNYVGFHLHSAPYHFTPAQIGSIFLVYLVGVVVTPVSGRLIDKYGSRAMLATGMGMSCAGLLLTLCIPVWAIVIGLTIFSSGLFVCQTAGSNRVGQVAKGARSSAAGLYASLYYLGGSMGVIVNGIFWNRGEWPAVVIVVVAVEIGAAAFALRFWKAPSTTIGKGPEAEQPADPS